MKIPFWKMHGAGNDFLLVDDRRLTFPVQDRPWRVRIAARRTGVGCEGILLLQPSQKAHFRMRFFNPDGSEADMCGNGARCIARLARDLDAAPDAMTIETAAGLLQARIAGRQVRLSLTPPTDWRMRRALALGQESIEYHFVNTGVPHAVVPVRDLDGTDVRRLGAGMRHHRDFAPAGTNANFILPTGPPALRVRTYERGVEDETLACGTGITASALIAGRLGLVTPPVQVTCASGDVLTVDYILAADSARDVTLLGPAEYVFDGVLLYPDS